MSKRHMYERWYYYPIFKRGMDRSYWSAQFWALVVAVFAGLFSQSFLMAIAFFISAVCYHVPFILVRQSMSAKFWGEGKYSLAFPILGLWFLRWGLFMYLSFYYLTVVQDRYLIPKDGVNSAKTADRTTDISERSHA